MIKELVGKLRRFEVSELLTMLGVAVLLAQLQQILEQRATTIGELNETITARRAELSQIESHIAAVTVGETYPVEPTTATAAASAGDNRHP
jgi:uncharacterized coiled-coil protein SlyX